MKATDETAVRELAIWTKNDGDVWIQVRESVEANLMKKWRKGTYDHTKAPKAWMYVADAGAKTYTRTFGGSGYGSFGCFDKATRQAVAQEMADDFHAALANGEYDE